MNLPEDEIRKAWEDLIWPLRGTARVLPLAVWDEPSAEALLAQLTSEERARYQQFGLEERRNEWLTGRRALLDLREELQAMDEAGGSRILTSLTHSEDFVLAVGAASSEGQNLPTGIGVDLEHRGRVVSEEARVRFVTEAESWVRLSPIEIWTIKEAAFKADASNAGGVISSYRIDELDAAGREGRVLAPSGHVIRFRILRADDWIVALAVA